MPGNALKILSENHLSKNSETPFQSLINSLGEFKQTESDNKLYFIQAFQIFWKMLEKG